MNALNDMLTNLTAEDGHAYGWGGGGLVAIVLIVLLLILIF